MLQIALIDDSKLNEALEVSLRELLNGAFEGDFAEEDWQHTLGGTRFVGHLNNQLIAHGSVVPRQMQVDDQIIEVGYVEGIAIAPDHWRKGYGSQLMEEITRYCNSKYSISILSTDEQAFYKKHGWSNFDGESYVSTNGIVTRSAEEVEGLMILFGLDQAMVSPRKVVCESRAGDAW